MVACAEVTDMSGRLEQALALHRSGQLAPARALYEELLRAQPGQAQVLHLLAVLVGQSGDFAKAAQLLGEVIVLDPDNARPHSDRGVALRALGHQDAALASYERAIALNANYTDAWSNRGNLLRELGRCDEALASYDRAIGLQPDFAVLHYNRGLALNDLKRRQEALASFDRALALDARYAAACLNRGGVLRELGQRDAALSSYERAIALDSGYVEAHYNRGVALGELQRWREALAAYERAVALDPGHAPAHFNRGAALSALKRPTEALAAYERAVACKADYAEAYHNRGLLLSELDRWPEALASYDRAVELNAGYPEWWLNRGNALAKLNQAAAALASYERALELQPDYAEVYANRGNALRQLHGTHAALASLDRAIEINPKLAEAHVNRGQILRELGQLEAAVASFERATELGAVRNGLPGLKLFARMQTCAWDGFDGQLAALTAGLERGEPVANPGLLAGLCGSAQLQRRAAELWAKHEYPANISLPPLAVHPRRDKIRIGYFSRDFRAHPVGFAMAQLIEMHDRSGFEVIAFSSGPDTGDDVRRRLERACDRFIDVREKSAAETALLARSLEIDIGVDLGGFGDGGRPEVLAQRAAPLQVGYLGYPCTTGAEYLDYIVGDATVMPAGSECHYSEKIVYLPNSFFPSDSTRQVSDRPFTRRELGLPDSGCVFCCFNRSYKITPALFDVWMRILQRVEGSVLWLTQFSVQASGNLRREAGRRGVNAQRLVFAPLLASFPQHLARHRAADLFLDTSPYNAHSTANDALWAGLPVLTRAGEAFAERVGASLLNSIGLPELVVSSWGEYEDLAVALAADPPRLNALRQRLAHNRGSHPLFDTRLLARHLESAFRQIVARQDAGLAPAHIRIPSEVIPA
jgi:predicted O-linked N-acetylglucosamine transferase (SPINDLY family)